MMQNNVKDKRLKMELSADTLAKMVGITRSSLYAVENLSATHVSFSLIQRLTTALKCKSVRDLFPGTMCPEISQNDLRAHKSHHRTVIGASELMDDASNETTTAPNIGPVAVGSRVRVRAGDIHEKAYVGEVVEVSQRMFVVRHPKGWKECFLWDDLDGCKVRPCVEGWEVGML